MTEQAHHVGPAVTQHQHSGDRTSAHPANGEGACASGDAVAHDRALGDIETGHALLDRAEQRG